MKLIAAHRILITAGVLFCLGFCVYQVIEYRDDGGVLDLLLAVLFALISGGLMVYLVNLRRYVRIDER